MQKSPAGESRALIGAVPLHGNDRVGRYPKETRACSVGTGEADQLHFVQPVVERVGGQLLCIHE